jgi:hypothetical protein
VSCVLLKLLRDVDAGTVVENVPPVGVLPPLALDVLPPLALDVLPPLALDVLPPLALDVPAALPLPLLLVPPQPSAIESVTAPKPRLSACFMDSPFMWCPDAPVHPNGTNTSEHNELILTGTARNLSALAIIARSPRKYRLGRAARNKPDAVPTRSPARDR